MKDKVTITYRVINAIGTLSPEEYATREEAEAAAPAGHWVIGVETLLVWQ